MHESTQALRGKKLFLVGFTLFSMFFGAGNLIFPPFLGAQKIRGDLRSPRQHNVRAFAVPHDPLHQGLHSGAFLRKPHRFHTFRERREQPALCFKLPCAEHVLRSKALQFSDAFSQFPVQFVQRPDSF